MVNEILFQLYILVGIILLKYFLEWQWPGLPHMYQVYFTGGVWVLFGIQIFLYVYQLKVSGASLALIHILMSLIWAGYLMTQYRQIPAKTVHQPFSRVHDSELYQLLENGEKDYIELGEGLQNIDTLLYRTQMRDHATVDEGIPGFSTQTNVLKTAQSEKFQTDDILEIVLKNIETKLNYNANNTHEINNFPGGRLAIVKIIEEQVLDFLGNLVGSKSINEIDNPAKMKRIIEDSENEKIELNKRLAKQGINVYSVDWVRVGNIGLPAAYVLAKEAIVNTGLKNKAAEDKLKAIVARLSHMPKDNITRQMLQEMLTAEGVIHGYNFSGSHADKVSPLLEVVDKDKE